MLMKTRTEPVDDHQATLEDLLSRWHDHTSRHKMTRGFSSQPMFRYTQRPRGGQTVEALMDDETERGQMDSITHEVSELPEDYVNGVWARPYRSAINTLARNCHSGANVWDNPRLPKDPMERGEVIQKARSMLIQRLRSAGVME